MKERDEFYRLEPRKHSLNLFVEHLGVVLVILGFSSALTKGLLANFSVDTHRD